MAGLDWQLCHSRLSGARTMCGAASPLKVESGAPFLNRTSAPRRTDSIFAGRDSSLLCATNPLSALSLGRRLWRQPSRACQLRRCAPPGCLLQGPMCGVRSLPSSAHTGNGLSQHDWAFSKTSNRRRAKSRQWPHPPSRCKSLQCVFFGPSDPNLGSHQ